MTRHLKAWLTRPQILVHGRYPRWRQAMAPGRAVWAGVGDYEVARSYRLGKLPTWRRRFVIPLLDRHVPTMPTPCWALVPGAAARRHFAEKARFALYAKAEGLEDFVPASLDVVRCDQFPAVLKRTDRSTSEGVAIVRDRAELAALKETPPWAGHPVLLQEFIAGAIDHVTHLVAVDGRIAWHVTYAYELPAGGIRPGDSDYPLRASAVSAAELALFERFLGPVHYDGPANIDFKRRADGRLAILEINPRFGASLMRPEHRADLAAALRTILAHARWHTGEAQ